MALQASFSSSSSFCYEWRYDVFLSFRGSDTRHGFTGNLYKALTDKGIGTFFDDQELQGGEEITPALAKAIQDSRIAIVVFSVNYASSSFCLHELATIMECVKGEGRLVLPVFYDVDPCDVRHHQKGSYGEAMTKHEKRFKDDNERVQKWKEALCQAANLSGKHFKLGNEYEHVFIQKIAKMISKKIERVPLHITDHPIGLESRVLKVNSLLDDGLDEVLMVGIYGIGGIGKTTLARAVYNFIADQFEGLCFLENVREKSIKLGLAHLQETLLSEILGDRDISLGSVSQGIPIIKQKLYRKKVLLVLDDVDNFDQLRATIGGADWLGSGSRVIITTRDKHLLASHGVKRQYEVHGLSNEEALALLGWNAFKDENIDPSYMDILKHAVTYACGLPLALQIIGTNLFGKSIEEWRSALDQYAKIPDKKIQEILKISFNALEECHKQIFLDIVCCYNGCNWGEVQDILHARHDVSSKYGISVLVQKSLLMHNKYGYVTIHDLIRDMSEEIIRQESPKHPGNRSRLWIPKDVVQVLEENTGTNDIEIMILDPPTIEELIVEWDGKAFEKMKNLEILIIRHACFSQDANHLPNSLRVLEWWNYPSNSLPSDFHPKQLAIFNLPRSELTSAVFVQKRKFMSLKLLKLGNSKIEHVPDLSGVPNLETLSFEGCENLIKVHESVGFLKKLCWLWASRCSKLKSFPALMLPSLKRLELSSCSSLENFPEILGHMEGIIDINLENTSIKELPSSIANLSNLASLTMGVSGMLRLPNSIATLPDLKHLDIRSPGGLQVAKPKEDEGKGSSVVSTNVRTAWLEHCNMPDESIRILLAWFCNVVELHLRGNDFTILPESIKELCSLRELYLDDCKKLREIKGIPPNIKTLSAANCISLTPSCRSMLLKEEYHSSNEGRSFHLPGSIPEWFEHRSTNSISFWFRNNIPSVSLCVVLGSDSSGYKLIWPDSIINGNRRGGGVGWSAARLIHVADHITIVESKSFLECGELLSENEWNHVVVRVSRDDTSRPPVKEFGIRVHKHESNTDDIRFIEPRQDTDVDLSSVPPATQLHSDPCSEPTLLWRDCYCYGKLRSNTEREIEEEEEEAGEEEEEEERGGNDEHKNTTFVPGPLLRLEDQIERHKEDESLRTWKGKLLGCLKSDLDGQVDPEVKFHSIGIISRDLAKDPTNITEVAPDRSRTEEWSKIDDEEKKGKCQKRKACATLSSIDDSAKAAKASKPRRGANALPIRSPSAKSSSAVIANDSPSVNPADKGSAQEISSATTSTSHSSKGTQNVEKPQGTLLRTALAQVQQIAPCPISQLETEPSRPRVQAVLPSTPTIIDAAIPQQLENLAAIPPTKTQTPPTNTIFEKGGFSFDEPSAEVIKEKTIDLGSLDLTEEDLDFGDLVSYLDPEHKTTKATESNGVKSREGPPPIQTPAREQTLADVSLQIPRELFSRVLSLLNHPLEELTSDEVLKQKMVEVVSTLGEVTAPSVVQPICSSLQYFVESSLEKIPNVNSLKTQYQETSLSLSKLKASAQPLKKAKETASNALSRGENKLSELTSEIRALEASKRALEEQMGTSCMKFDKIKNKLLFVEEQIREKELAIEGMKKAIEEGEAAKASLLEEQESLKLKLRTLMN